MKNRVKGQGKGKGKGKAFTCHKRSYEAHFNDITKEASTLGTIPSNPEMPKVTDTDDMDMGNMIVEYHSNDVFGDLK
jgi:spore cortex formation protein SpoVR/YcgB (stage V sporulation)